MTTQKPTHAPPCDGNNPPELWGQPYSDGDVPCALCAMWLVAPETAAERDRLKEVNKDLLAALKMAEGGLEFLGDLIKDANVGRVGEGFLRALPAVRAAIARAEGK